MSPRARGIIADNNVYHVISRGNNCQKIFKTDEDFRRYQNLIQKYKDKFPVRLFHYCLMHNHIHLLIQTVTGNELPKFMKGLNHAYSVYHKRVHGYVGHLWQSRYKSFYVGNDAYLLECGRYIERNPVRAGLVKDPKEWKWSAYRHYAYGKTDSLIDTYGLYLELSDNLSTRQNIYRNYLLTERPYENILDRHFDLV